MKVVLSIILLILFFIPSSASSSYNGIPVKYHAHLDRAFQKAGQNRPALLETLNKSPRKQKEAFAFLLSWMPERDLRGVPVLKLYRPVQDPFIEQRHFIVRTGNIQPEKAAFYGWEIL